MITLREPTAADWESIGLIANEAVRHIAGAPAQTEWLQNRIGFAGWRCHCIAERDGRVVGYGAIERQSHRAEDGRLFLVVSWSSARSIETADALLSRLREDPTTDDIEQVWLREYFDDAPFVDFLLARGFEISDDFARDGIRIVVLTSRDWKRNSVRA